MLVDPRYRRLLRRFTPLTVFMHVGAADCSLAILAAGFVERAYAVDPLTLPARGTRLPINLRLVASSEAGLPIPEGSVDIALAEDPTKLRFIRRCLVPGGLLLSPDRALSDALRDAGFARIRLPWLEPVIEGVKR